MSKTSRLLALYRNSSHPASLNIPGFRHCIECSKSPFGYMQMSQMLSEDMSLPLLQIQMVEGFGDLNRFCKIFLFFEL
jgi:hypothetical protein